MYTELLEKNIIISASQLEEIFYSGIKKTKKIGIELEKLPVRKNNFEAVSYYEQNGICSFLKKYAEIDNWQNIAVDDNLLGLKSDIGSISLEPGSQFELSLLPQENIHAIKKNIYFYNQTTASIANNLDFFWLGYGIQPVSTYHNIDIIPKKRYEFMTEHLSNVANLPLVMMRETAGIQVAFDYDSEQDAINKLRLAIKLSPIISAMYANSPIRNSQDTGYKSFRAKSWLETDNKRCGLISEKLFDSNYNFTFKDYVETLLDVPMIFVQKGDNYFPAPTLTFRNYLKNGYNGYQATLDDWYLHMNLYFPDVRLSSYIEVRNQDTQRAELIPSIPALWKGILYNQDAFEAINSLLSGFDYQDFLNIRALGPKYGLEFKIKNKNILDIAKEIINISRSSLVEQGLGEEIYLEPLANLTNRGLTPADIILKNWYGAWDEDISKLIEYSKLT